MPCLLSRFADIRRFAPIACALAMLIATTCGGCVQRRMTVRTNPPGARVYIDDHEIGTTPCSTDYIYYGSREIRLVKDGYETLTVKQKLPPPWYEYFPIDFISENIVPAEIRDERCLNFSLQPQQIVPTDQLLGRAQQLRDGSHSPSFTPPPPVENPTVTAPAPWKPVFSGSKFDPL